ncbi:hypothetical protein JOQ06_011129, partial [Pogonophryne albipinna]
MKARGPSVVSGVGTQTAAARQDRAPASRRSEQNQASVCRASRDFWTPWRLAIQPAGQVIQTGANVMSLTTKKHLVAMELELLSDTHSERQEVLRTGLN